MSGTTIRRSFLGGTAAALLLVAAGPSRAADELTVFDWPGYEDPLFHPGFVDKHEASPSFAYFGDEEEAFQKLRAGFRADLAHPCSQSTIKWREAGLLEPIDTSRIPAWDDLYPQLRDLPGFTHDGQAWVMPWEWGSTGLVYRTDEVDAADIGSLRAFADPKFEGRVSMPDNVDDAYALAALVLGIPSWQTATLEDVDRGSAFLREIHPNVVVYWTDNTELAQAMQSGEVSLAWAWSETPVTLVAAGHPVAMKRDTKEGVSTWVCGYALLSSGEGSSDLAYDFLNAILELRAAEYLVGSWGYGHPNAKAMAQLDPAVLKEKGYTDVAGFSDDTFFQAPVPTTLKQRMVEEYEKIKAGF